MNNERNQIWRMREKKEAKFQQILKSPWDKITKWTCHQKRVRQVECMKNKKKH